MPCERLAGITGFTIDGVSYMVVADVNWSPGRWRRETLVGLDSVHGFSEVPLQGFISAQLRDSNQIVVGDFTEMRCVEVQIQLANGKVVGGANMWNVEAIEVNAADATFRVRFDGVDVREM